MSGRGVVNDAGSPSYHDFISDELFRNIERDLVPVDGVADLWQLGAVGGLETPESLRFLCELYEAVKAPLDALLRARVADRAFIDERTRACCELNRSLRVPFGDAHYRTVIGQEDGRGRVVIGPRAANYDRAGGRAVAPIPAFLQGSHVTLFGPPDDAKLSINAMNAFHRSIKDEPAIVAELLRDFRGSVKWGADDEDSKTPLREDLVVAGEHLTACMEGTLSYIDARTGKHYALASTNRALPIKRLPGLALPCIFLYLRGTPLALHLYDFALHLFTNWQNPEALVFYLPKLENEEEAAYVRLMIERAEQLISAIHPTYQLGTIRVMIVLENPRALFRVHEIMDALHPYFAGASLGWHDFLASTARVMKHESHYRIPVKSDPNIVIKHIKASHDLLAEVVGSRGGIKVGGMYGVLPTEAAIESASFQVAIKGFIKDVIAQMKRNLDGFWVAHPDFVRIGVALVEGWKRSVAGDSAPLDALVRALLNPNQHDEVLAFIHSADVRGLDRADPRYPRALLVADGRTTSALANNDPQEIRYNIFQSLQYLTDWLCGNGCVALPASIDGVAVRIMDDLATAERSRWEVWHELHHGRFSYEDFVRLMHEEMHFIRHGCGEERKSVEVTWNDRTRKWYPVAMNLLLQLMADEEPVEFATELLLPFTLERIRSADDPWAAAQRLDAKKFLIPPTVARLNSFFSACGCARFAASMAHDGVTDLRCAERLVRSFTLDEVNEAARFHGDIGQSAHTLDATAAREQARVLAESAPSSAASADASIASESLVALRVLAGAYQARFGFKFLVAAKGRSVHELLEVLRARIDHPPAEELECAREALWQITEGRLRAAPVDSVASQIAAARERHGVKGASIAVMSGLGRTQSLELGTRDALNPVTPKTRFEIASLSKSIAAAFAIEYFSTKRIALSTCVNALFASTPSSYRIRSLDTGNPQWGDRVTIAHLLSHHALNMHYVNGVSASDVRPPIRELLDGIAQCDDAPVGVISEPGATFHYSGGGFMVLQHLIESLERSPIHILIDGFLRGLGMNETSFEQRIAPEQEYASGFLDSGEPIAAARKFYPPLAAGATSTARDVARFLTALAHAHRDLAGCGPISHECSVRMVHGSDKGALEFMGCTMGLGIFIAEAGANRLAIHQGANDGFRALFVHCYAGPDAGKGFIVLCNGEESGMLFIAEVAHILLSHLDLQGVDCTRVVARTVAPTVESFAAVAQEHRVNTGFRELVFSIFDPDLPEAIVTRGELDRLSQFNLAVGARIEAVSNQRFARAENVLSPHLPLFDPTLFGRQGKTMDSWETVRHNVQECDWLVFELATAFAIDCLSISTQFHSGNHAEEVAIDGWDATTAQWQSLVARSPLVGHANHLFECAASTTMFRRIRVRIFPDGGLTRLALYGANLPAHEREELMSQHGHVWPPVDSQSRKPLAPTFTASDAEIEANFARCALGGVGGEIDLASAAFGGRVVFASNEHYSAAANVISPFAALNMADGLESARSRLAHHSEEVVIALGREATIARIELDFSHFVNNNPREIAIEGLSAGQWIALVARTDVKAFGGNAIAFSSDARALVEQVRVTLFPDGGVNRIRVWC